MLSGRGGVHGENDEGRPIRMGSRALQHEKERAGKIVRSLGWMPEADRVGQKDEVEP